MAAPEQEFSYEKDVAPHASRFFDRVSSSRMSQGSKTALQGMLLNGMEDIQNQRRVLQKEREDGIGRRLDNERTIGVLEDARAERARREQAEAQRGGIRGAFSEVLSGGGTSEEKRQRIAQLGMDHADALTNDKVLGNIFEMANKALPKDDDKLTTGQTAAYISKMYGKVLPEEMDAILKDGKVLGSVLGAIEQSEAASRQAAELRERQDKDADKIKLDYATKPLKWKTKDDTGQVDASVLDKKGKPMWLDDESTNEAARIIKVLGTPDEQERFDELQGASSDRERHTLIQSVQNRYQYERINGRRPLSPDEAKINPKATEGRAKHLSGIPD